MHPYHGEGINLNPKLGRGELPPLEFAPVDPALVAAGRKAVAEIAKRREEERVELWNGVQAIA